MKSILFTLFILASIAGFSQETFTVLFIKGEVTNGATGAKINKGDKLSSTDKLVYKTLEDMIAAISPSQGRVILKPVKDQSAKQSELAFVIKDIFMPVKSNAMTRGEVEEMAFANDYVVEAFFDRGNYLLLDGTSWMFDEEEYPIESGDYFAIQYKHAHDITEKRLPYANGKVTISLFQLFGEQINPADANHFKLIIVQKGKTRLLASPKFVFVNEKELKEELALIKSSGVANPSHEVSAYVEATYGYFDSGRIAVLYNELP